LAPEDIGGLLMRVLPWLCLVLPLAACGDVRELRTFGGPTMGSTYEVKYFADVAVADARAVVERELAAFDLAFSNWRDDSEIARLNAHASTAPFPVSERFASVLQLALAVAVATEGAFDPTVKPLSDLYRARKRDPAKRLDAAALDAAKAAVGYQLVQLRDRQVSKVRPEVQLDLDGLVAGAAADSIAAELARLGIVDLYLEVTGEVLCRGSKPGGEPWRIGVVDPRADVLGGDTPIRVVALRNEALCTSGDYRNALAVDGQAVHHVFDPRTGRSAARNVASASVLAPSAAVADAIGTALMVLGPEGSRRRWAPLAALGARGALLLAVAADGEIVVTDIDWPAGDG
jgi:thiamine biosynthesis lipoprotein